MRVSAAIYHRRMLFLIARGSHRRIWLTAAHGLLMITLCPGCMGPFHYLKPSDSCGQLVCEDDTGDSPVSADCGSEECCHEGFGHRIGRKVVHTACLPYQVCCCVADFCVPGGVVHTACLPYRICCRVANSCVPDRAAGPPDVAGPGRFHPVPTHPVFAPVPAPLAYPAEFSIPSP